MYSRAAPEALRVRKALPRSRAISSFPLKHLPKEELVISYGQWFHPWTSPCRGCGFDTVITELPSENFTGSNSTLCSYRTIRLEGVTTGSSNHFLLSVGPGLLCSPRVRSKWRYWEGASSSLKSRGILPARSRSSSGLSWCMKHRVNEAQSEGPGLHWLEKCQAWSSLAANFSSSPSAR